ncbi:hypothetical protein [Gordonia effusa]|uniref:hypothetical protein n=1 Tax=Gordonia effusa TaxID=263908 RepID=UPI0002F5DACC|nr:hypothetical protein [Gordonia effusa]
MTDRISAVARQHADELRNALTAFTRSRPEHADLAWQEDSPPSERDEALCERLRAAADYADLPPQILLPAHLAHDSPHRRG